MKKIFKETLEKVFTNRLFYDIVILTKQIRNTKKEEKVQNPPIFGKDELYFPDIPYKVTN